MTDPPLDQTLRSAQAFVRDALVPLEPLLLAQDYDRLLPALASARDHVKALGLLAPHMPRGEGGLGLSLADFGRLSEVLGWSPLGHYAFNCQAPDVGNMELLHRHGSAAQKARFLAPLVRGEVRSCFSMTEPERAGSNPVHLDTTARVDGDDYVIAGHKWFTSSADGAAFAVVMAVTNPDVPSPHARASQILVPLDTPGVRIVRTIPVMGETGRGWFSHAEIEYVDVRVPRANRIGAEGAGFVLAQERLGPGRIHHCMRWIGLAERALDVMCRRAASRELAPGRPLGAQQAVQHWLAESRAEIHASRLMVLDAARKIDDAGAHAARVDVSLIKFYVAGTLQRVVDRAVQVCGALGVTDDTILSWIYRHERAARIYDGPDEVHKSVVARHMLKAYGVDVAI
ncbi:acyl-CoA dehydrogenase domain-containing protein (plasmid) [Gemmatirosa kalamazoonensis]|uniref:Acyl-CoA dehydrogenase domain-containing protein n=1 Tax=Gemmatirosa kalamazoonensis TaxID=861299 RepID=W0RSJ5_9BACT|nr:acyl-CoA dehydrogenase family protein [Gemmatirosa kalamazoonensis]AHG93666.1 acyl-CoA dehydrogenase domain-containing protein [Gemmatirosa kalamazoonensis]